VNREGPLAVAVADDQIHVGDRFAVAFERTLRVPVEGSDYPLPPGLGRFPIRDIPTLGLAIPLWQREALWLAFDGTDWKPNAVQVGVGGINAVSGERWTDRLAANPQNYVVTPHQLWLDGINAGAGTVRQFVAVPLGTALTVEGQLTGREDVVALQLRVFEPQPGRFPDEAPPPPEGPQAGRPLAGAIGVGAGGRIRQRIHPDHFGIDTWDPGSATEVTVHLVNSEQWEQATGEPPPPSPVDAATYTAAGLPWFERYDERHGDVAAPERLQRVRPFAEGNDTPVEIDPRQIRPVDPDADATGPASPQE
jgi:hypothetical protein